MKKFYIALSIIVMFVFMGITSSVCSATTFGVHMGTGQSQYSGDVGGLGIDLSDETTNMIGIYANIPVPRMGVQIQPELNYITEKFDLLDSGIETHTFNYLQLPVLVKMESGTVMDTKAFLGAGPYVSILLNDPEDVINRMDFGYVLSTGITVHDAVSFEFRHTQGFVDVSHVSGVDMKISRDVFLMGFNF